MDLAGRSRQTKVCMKGNGRMGQRKVEDAWKMSKARSTKETGRMTCEMELDVKLTKTETSTPGTSWKISDTEQVPWNTPKSRNVTTETGSKAFKRVVVSIAGEMETLIRENSQKIK